MSLPIRERSHDWVVRALRINSDELKKYANARGKYSIAVLDSVLMDLIADVKKLKNLAGVGSVDLEMYGDRIVALVDSLFTGITPCDRDWLEELCGFLMQLSPQDFLLLNEFWALRHPAGKIADKILRAQNHAIPSQVMFLVVENLRHIERAPRPHLPVSS